MINDAQSPNTIDSQRFLKPKAYANPTNLDPSSIANDCSINQLSTIKKRRKRDVQAITMIVQTKEFPYNDQHEWKNNGNTVNKNSGKRSIYYKCVNSRSVGNINKQVCEVNFDS